MSEGPTAPMPDEPGEDTLAARARALSSPVRWRVLRACLHEARTNKELSDLLGVNPGSMLHHVRTLVATGFLAPQEPRRGARNAVEIPYLATELTFQSGPATSEFSGVLHEPAAGAADGRSWQAALELDPCQRAEFEERVDALLSEFGERAGGPAGDDGAWTVSVTLRPAATPPG